jgi:hypothetical protein
MRLTIALLGFELDMTLGPAAADDAADEDPAAALNGGTLASQPISFVGTYDVPEEVSAPQHCPSWDEPEERR